MSGKTFITVLITCLFILIIPAPADTGDRQNITFFHTNDMHGTIKTMGKIFVLVNNERKINKNVYLINSGDNFSGNPAVDQFNPKGEPMLILMNRLQFNVEALGNHDFDYGQKILKSFIFRAKFPILCANIKVLPKNDFPRPYPYYLVENEDGTEIVFLGVIQIEKNTGIPSTLPQRVRGLKFSDGIETVKKYMWLKRENNILVVVSHLGIEDDIKLAEQTRGIDLIIGGHSHTVIKNPKEVNGTLIVQAGSYLKYLGRVDLTLIDGKIISKKGRLITLSKIQIEDLKTKELAEKFNNNPVLKRVLTHFKIPVRGRKNLGLMVCDAIRSKLNLDIVFYNSGGIRIDELSGNVTIKDIYSMHPFGNYIVKLKMDTDEIKDLIKNDYLAHRELDLLPSGISYRLIKDLQNRIIDVELFDSQGKEFPDDKKFSVGLNNYIFTSYKFKHKDPGISTNMKTVDIVLDYMRKLKKYPDYSKIVRTKALTIFSGKLDTIGKAGSDIFTNEKKFDVNSNTGNLIADSIRNFSGSDIAIFPTRLLKTGIIIEAGKNIFTEHLPGLYSHIKDNRITTVRMSGKTLYNFLLQRFKSRNNLDVHVSGINCILERDEDGKIVNLKIKTAEGNNLSFTDYFNISFVDYDFNRYYKFSGELSDKKISDKKLFPVLRNYIKKRGTISSNIDKKRINFIN